MKFFIIAVAVLLVMFVAFQIFAMSSRSDIESYPYEVVKQYDDFEIRQYEARLFTSVKVSAADYKSASSRGFSKLGGYIFGANDGNEKIAMTSPVTMSLEDSMTMKFMVPKDYKKEDLPTPNESDITFEEEPERLVAAISFGGWANDKKIEEYKTQLVAALDEAGVKYNSNFYFYGYNAPYDMIGRKNEVIVELQK